MLRLGAPQTTAAARLSFCTTAGRGRERGLHTAEAARYPALHELTLEETLTVPPYHIIDTTLREGEQFASAEFTSHDRYVTSPAGVCAFSASLPQHRCNLHGGVSLLGQGSATTCRYCSIVSQQLTRRTHITIQYAINKQAFTQIHYPISLHIPHHAVTFRSRQHSPGVGI